MFLGVFILAINLVWILNKPKEELVLTPMIPGVNIPNNQLPYYFLAILISTVFHEFAHAIAGIRERVPFSGFGVFFTFMHPAAYAEFRVSFEHLTHAQQLKIYCAGAWHNVVIAIACIALFLSFPILMSPFYSQSNGMVITNVVKGSAFEGSLQVGDIIHQIGDFKITDGGSYGKCFHYLIGDYKKKGFCFPEAFEAENVRNTKECCETGSNSSYHCFERTQDGELICAPAKGIVLENFLCTSELDCNIKESSSLGYCFKPRLPDDFMFMKIYVRDKEPLAYLGQASDIWYSVEVSQYQPRSLFFFLSPSLPLVVYKILQYLLSISSALAILNMAPVTYLDGGWAFVSFLKLLFPQLENRTVETLEKITSYVTGGLLALNILFSWIVFT